MPHLRRASLVLAWPGFPVCVVLTISRLVYMGFSDRGLVVSRVRQAFSYLTHPSTYDGRLICARAPACFGIRLSIAAGGFRHRIFGLAPTALTILSYRRVCSPPGDRCRLDYARTRTVVSGQRPRASKRAELVSLAVAPGSLYRPRPGYRLTACPGSPHACVSPRHRRASIRLSTLHHSFFDLSYKPLEPPLLPMVVTRSVEEGVTALAADSVAVPLFKLPGFGVVLRHAPVEQGEFGVSRRSAQDGFVISHRCPSRSQHCPP